MRQPLMLVTCAVLAGCASEAQETGTATLAPAPSQAAPAQTYQLSAKEMSLDCAKLAGTVRMRTMQLKDAEGRSGPTVAGRAIHEVAAAVNNAPRRGIDPAGDNAQDRAQLEAFKRRMAEKKCKPVEDGGAVAKPAAKAK